MELYPKILNRKKISWVYFTLICISFLICATMLLLNKILQPNVHWALIVILGIMYIWTTVYYAIQKSANIASHVMVQMICSILLIIGIDICFGMKCWSFYIGVPIIAIISNITMLFLTILSYKRYMRYAIYHILIFIFSMFPILFLWKFNPRDRILTYISLGIAGITMIVTIFLCGKELKEELKKRLHI